MSPSSAPSNHEIWPERPQWPVALKKKESTPRQLAVFHSKNSAFPSPNTPAFFFNGVPGPQTIEENRPPGRRPRGKWYLWSDPGRYVPSPHCHVFPTKHLFSPPSKRANPMGMEQTHVPPNQFNSSVLSSLGRHDLLGESLKTLGSQKHQDTQRKATWRGVRGRVSSGFRFLDASSLIPAFLPTNTHQFWIPQFLKTLVRHPAVWSPTSVRHPSALLLPCSQRSGPPHRGIGDLRAGPGGGWETNRPTDQDPQEATHKGPSLMLYCRRCLGAEETE